jgi:glycine/D-amino acid oxidase-like deaminating enzyme
MKRIVENEIVIVGGGICGLATALALHRFFAINPNAYI